MKLLPYGRFKIKTELSYQDVLKILNSNTEPWKDFRVLGSEKKPYQGKIEGSHFEISRIRVSGERGSLMTIIKGDVKAETNGSSISILIQPHIVVIAGMIIWLGAVGWSFLVALSSFLWPSPESRTTGPSFLTTMIIFWLGGLFWIEAKFHTILIKRYFLDLLGAKEI